MVNYALTNDRRRDLIIRLMALSGVIAIAMGQGFPHLLGFLSSHLDTRWQLAISPPSTLAIFGVLYFLIEKYLWRRWPLRLYLGIPDMSGTWRGVAFEQDSRAERKGDRLAITVEIHQSLFRISFYLQTDPGVSPAVSSSTLSASIDNDSQIFLRNTYQQPSRAWGTSELRFIASGARATLEGRYVNDRPLVGRLELVRDS